VLGRKIMDKDAK
jgi:hypothetical protein